MHTYIYIIIYILSYHHKNMNRQTRLVIYKSYKHHIFMSYLLVTYLLMCLLISLFHYNNKVLLFYLKRLFILCRIFLCCEHRDPTVRSSG